MRRTTILPTGESLALQAQVGTDPPHHILAADRAVLDLLAPDRPLPCWADRQRIIEQASLTLAKAQATAAHFDRFFTLLPAERANAVVFSKSSFQWPKSD
jgi:hypothetical protein